LSQFQHRREFLSFSAILVLAGCGGGDGGGPPNPPTASAPSAGNYAVALKAEGPANAPKIGISLVHPSAPTIEYEIVPASTGVSDVKTVYSGTPSGTTISNITPYALLYISNGDVKRLLLTANGLPPAGQVQGAGASDACTFEIDANDYATPGQSRFIVSTKGIDNLCGTTDDGQAAVIVDNGGKPSYTARTGQKTLGAVMSQTLPVGWLDTLNGAPHSTIYFWGQPSMIVSLVDRVVAGLPNSMLVEANNKLRLFSATPTSYSQVDLNATLTAGSGWQLLGFDANNIYVYRNTGTTTASTWKVVGITRTTPTAAQLASGSGLLAAAAMGTDVLYLSIQGSLGNELLSLDKTGGVPQILESTLSTTISTVLTSSAGVHQLWRVGGIGTGATTSAIEMIDEQFNKLYTAPLAFPMGIVPASSEDRNVSENRSRFLYAAGYTWATGFSGANLVSYDATNKSTTFLGNLPGTSKFGSSLVYSTIVSGSTGFNAGFVAAMSGGNLLTTGASVFSVDVSTGNTLKLATTKQ
jgi:hypothetical protein